MEDTKICSKCGRKLPLSEFNKDKSKKDGLNAWCKDCKKQYMKEYKKEWYATLEGYTYNIRYTNLLADRKHGRCGKDEDPLPPHSYYIEKFTLGIDYYDGKKYDWSELGFDRIDDSLPHSIDNVIVATTFHNVDRYYKRMSVEEYREYIQNQLKKEKEELELVL